MINILWIALGGAIGAVSRYGITQLVSQRIHSFFPWGTFTVNMIGSFFLGFLFELSQKVSMQSSIRSMLTIGLLGAFTTFSTFSLETANLLREKEYGLAASNAVISMITGIAACFLGILCIRFITKVIVK